jgi:hypothetical protein
MGAWTLTPSSSGWKRTAAEIVFYVCDAARQDCTPTRAVTERRAAEQPIDEQAGRTERAGQQQACGADPPILVVGPRLFSGSYRQRAAFYRGVETPPGTIW